MTLEAAAVISADEKEVLFWHLPADRSVAFLPDTAGTLWDALRKHWRQMAGTVHSHPGHGIPHPSYEDLTSYDAFEFWSDRRFRWWVASMDRLVRVEWEGPERYDYRVTPVDKDAEPPWVDELRRLSRERPMTSPAELEV